MGHQITHFFSGWDSTSVLYRHVERRWHLSMDSTFQILRFALYTYLFLCFLKVFIGLHWFQICGPCACVGISPLPWQIRPVCWERASGADSLLCERLSSTYMQKFDQIFRSQNQRLHIRHTQQLRYSTTHNLVVVRFSNLTTNLMSCKNVQRTLQKL